MIPDGITDTKNVITTVNIFVEVEKGFLEMFVLGVFSLCAWRQRKDAVNFWTSLTFSSFTPCVNPSN